MSIIKLRNAGESLTARIVKCEVVSGKFGEQVLFATDKGDDLYIGREPADRQLLRCGFSTEPDGDGDADYRRVLGNILTFAREPNKTKGAAPYWSITVAAKADLIKAPQKRLSGPNDAPSPDAFARSLRDDPRGAGDVGEPPEAIDYPVREPGGQPMEAREPGEELLDDAEQAKQERDAQIRRVMVLGLALWDKVAAHQVAAGKADNYPVDAASISRFASTLFIEMNHRNLLR